MEIEEIRPFALMENLPLGVFVVDSAGAIKTMNASARVILAAIDGINPFLQPGKNFAICSPDGSLLQGGEGLLPGRLWHGENVRNRVVLVRLAGHLAREISLKVNAVPWMDSSGEVQGAVVVVEDVSEQHESEEKLRAETSRARLLASLSRAFTDAGSEYPAILHTIARTVSEAIGTACLIRMAARDSSHLQLAGWHHAQPGAMEIFASLERQPVPVENSLEGQIFSSRSAILLDSAHNVLHAPLTADIKTVLERYPVHSIMIAPMFVSGHSLGTISLWRSPDMPVFAEEDLEFFQELASRAAMAVENARLYGEEVQRNRELNALRDATLALMSTLDLELLLGRILDAAQHAIPAAERGLLFLAAPRTGRLELRAMLGFNDPRIRRSGFLKNGSIQRAISDRKPFLINDIFEEGGHTGPNEDHPAGETPQEEESTFFRSAIFAPLVLNNEVLGVLTLSSSRTHAFAEADLRLLVSFAATTIAALQNATLHAEVQRIAITDALTGLYNRRGLEELGRHEVERFQRFGHPLSLAMFDIDHFKHVNDTYGHGVGDQVLKGLAERCGSLIRQVDVFARFGGEEFVILLPETDLFQAVNIAERLRRATAEAPFITEQGSIAITISLGVTRASKNLAGLSVLLEQADMALYDAKIKGRNRVEIG